MFWHFMQIVSNGDNLHEMSNPVLCENKKSVTSLSSADLARRVVKVKMTYIVQPSGNSVPWPLQLDWVCPQYLFDV